MDDTTLGIIIVAMVVLVIYFIPTIIAFARSSSYAWVIFVLNLMGGWTGIAWFAAFIWALWPKGHSAASIDVNLNHRGAVDMGPMAYPIVQPPVGYSPHMALPQHQAPLPQYNKLEALERLAHLRTIGAISLEEFEQQKAILLRD